jgi:hypothetical protein
MKYVKMLIAATLVAAPMMVPGVVQAKSIKWSCVEVAPGTFVCYPSTNRP